MSVSEFVSALIVHLVVGVVVSLLVLLCSCLPLLHAMFLFFSDPTFEFCKSFVLLSLTRYCQKRGDKFWRWDKYENGLVRYLYTTAERVDNTTTAMDVARCTGRVNASEVLRSSLVLMLSNESTFCCCMYPVYFRLCLYANFAL